MQSLKFVCDETNSMTLELVKNSLEATGKFIVLLERTTMTNHSNLFGDFLFNAETRMLQWKEEEPVSITCRENKILFLLLENAGYVVKRRLILTSFWGDESQYASRSLDIFIHRLRKKLKRDPSVKIYTIRGEGFMLKF
jgi:DNA-binding response OmpR family regulator